MSRPPRPIVGVSDHGGWATAVEVLCLASINDLLEKLRASVGQPWQKHHKLARAAAIAATA